MGFTTVIRSVLALAAAALLGATPAHRCADRVGEGSVVVRRADRRADR